MQTPRFFTSVLTGFLGVAMGITTAGAADAAKDSPPAAIRMAGQWTLGPAAGAPYCVLLFTAAEADTGGVRPGDICRSEWRAKNFFTWHVAEGRLTLQDMQSRVIGTYIQRDANTFQDETEAGTPLFLARMVKK
jgi:hypothetical protein